jgi:hypothetical protein
VTDINWESLSAGEKENLRKQVCTILMENAEIAKHFELMKEKRSVGYGAKEVQYTLEARSDDSSVTISVHEDGKAWSPKAGVYIKRDDGYGGERGKTVRYKLTGEGDFNIEKAVAKALEMNRDSICYAEGQRDDKARTEHTQELKKLVTQELGDMLADEPWDVESSYNGVRLSFEGDVYSGPTLRIDVRSGRLKTPLKWEFALTGDARDNAILMKRVSDLTQVVSTVLESSEFQFALQKLPAFA